jgi:hypothetical protein
LLRIQDVSFVLFSLAIAAMVALHLNVAIVALVGAFACGSIYLLAGMLPDRRAPFWPRAFTTVFLSLVLSSLVLILPATLGAMRPGLQRAQLAVAGLLPVLAFCFEIARTPGIFSGLRRYFGRR